jgi:hypothetical protein
MANAWNELNVTDPVYGLVDPTSLADQSTKIQNAFKRLGKPASGANFGKTIYFPAGTYFFSKQLLNLNLAPNPDVVPNITIRGDGPGRTILKLYPNAFALSKFKNSDWLNPNSTELSVPDTASGSTINSAQDASVIGIAATRLYVSVRMPATGIPSGTKFEVLVNGTQVGSSYATYGDTFRLLEYSLSGVTAPYKVRLRLSGYTGGATGNVVEVSGIGWTVDDGTEPTIFKLTGRGTYTSPTNNTLRTLQYFTMKDLTLDGTADFNADGTPRNIVKANWFGLDRVSLIRMENVLITSTYGTAISAQCWWDSVMSDVQFSKCGSVGDSKPVVVLQVQNGTDEGSSKYTSCNNIKWISCRWESSDYISCLLDNYTRQIYYLGSKWHGKLILGPTGTSIVDFSQVNIKSHCSSISFTGCNMTNWSDTHIEATGAHGITVTGSSISGAGVQNTSTSRIKCGVLLTDCSGCSITGNGFGIAGLDVDNRDGDVRVFGTNMTRNFVMNNGGSPNLDFRESFAIQGNASGNIGELGWDKVSTPDVSVTLRSHQRIGIVHVKANVNGTAKGLRLNSGISVGVGTPHLRQGQILIRFTARLLGSADPVTSTAGFNFGLMEPGSTDFDPTGIYFRKPEAGVSLFGICKNSTGEMVTDMGLNQDELEIWHDFQIRIIPYKDPQYSPTLPTIGFRIDSGPELFLTKRIPTGKSLLPFLVVLPQESADKSIDVDSFNVEFVGGDTH